MNTVPRSCIELPVQRERHHDPPKPLSLSAFRNRPAYVLLGDPGEGKTTSLEAECDALGNEGRWIKARDFLTFGPQLEWREKTLFIDGLDEIRAGQADARTPFDTIRRHLGDLGNPHFRLSCRVADWLGANDRQHLNAVSPDGVVAVLRLEPLTDGDLKELIGNHPNIDDPQAFLDRAKERGIEPLLRNPKSLEMLITAFAERGELPDSRRDVFEVACQQLVLEHNHEHNALPAAAPPEDLLEIAGRLCALQLISGNAGFAILPNAVNDDYPDLRLCDPSPGNIGRQVLASKLFSSPVEGHVEPNHRQIAEFLGGRYLAKRIDDGVPLSRITALMTGGDGTVVTPLRGLSAWVAAHSPAARLDLIDRDAIGVGLYGDIGSFSLDEKRNLLHALKRSPLADRSYHDAAKALGPLAAPGIEDALRDFLNDPNRDDDAQQFTYFVLRVAARGYPLPELTDLLMQIVCDNTWRPYVKCAALDAFVHYCVPEQCEDKLGTLLEDVQSGKVQDDRNELLGRLLIALYPNAVAPRTVWDYLVDGSEDSQTGGRYFTFWSHTLLEKSSDEQVAELLDELVRRGLARRQILEPHYLQGLPAKLLVRGLVTHGEQLEAKRLYDWLGVSVEDFTLLSENADSRGKVRNWLAEHPGRIKDILIEGLRQASESDEFLTHVLDMETRLHSAHNAPSPPGFGLWCLEQAIRLDDAQPQAAEYLLDEAFRVLRCGEESGQLSEAILIDKVSGSPSLKARLKHLLAPPKDAERESWRRKRETKLQKESEEWLEAVRSHRIALMENRAPPRVLHQLALTYLGDSYRPAKTDGPAHIRKSLSGDNDLTQAVLSALRGVPDRDDVPAPDQVLQLYRRGELHFLNLPFLVGLAERERLGNDDVRKWPEDFVRTALIMRHCALWGDHDPTWHQQLVELRPAEVAIAIVRIGVSELKQGKAAGGLFWSLARDAAYGEVAEDSCLPLLSAFPTRCRVDQLGALDDLLWAAVRHADQDALRKLAEQKLTRKSMNSTQRIHWLAAARTAFGDAFQSELEASVATPRHEKGIAQLVVFFSCSAAKMPSLDEFGIGGIESLIRLFASICGPEDEFAEGIVTSVGEASGLVRSLVAKLSASPLQQASEALARLAANPDLSRWQRPLRHALEDQRGIRRDAEYRHPTINQVNETLNQGLPANAADLTALVADRLRAIAKTVRNSNTDDWRQYWNLDLHGKPVKPKHENDCRDALLSDLRQQLPAGVQAEPEGHQANDGRADIVVTYNGLQLQVEAKRSQSRDLWRALREQLIAKYAGDGPGIYLVFWFGSDTAQLPPEGQKPKNPGELEDRLMAQLSPEERRQIRIVAIDAGTPSTTEPLYGKSLSATPHPSRMRLGYTHEHGPQTRQ